MVQQNATVTVGGGGPPAAKPPAPPAPPAKKAPAAEAPQAEAPAAEAPQAETPEEKKRNKAPTFDLKNALDADGNAIPLHEGRLTALPANIPEGYARLKRDDFASKLLHAQYQLQKLEEAIENYQARVKEKKEEIEELKGEGDPTARKAKLAKKHFAQCNELLAQLKAEGYDTSSLGIPDSAQPAAPVEAPAE